jgi:hypothetical protein
LSGFEQVLGVAEGIVSDPSISHEYDMKSISPGGVYQAEPTLGECSDTFARVKGAIGKIQVL